MTFAFIFTVMRFDGLFLCAAFVLGAFAHSFLGRTIDSYWLHKMFSRNHCVGGFLFDIAVFVSTVGLFLWWLFAHNPVVGGGGI